MRPPAARCEVRGHRQQAALKDQRFRGRVPPLYPLTRAHEVDSATRWGRHLAAAAIPFSRNSGSGPRRSLRRSAERPARAAWAALRLLADVAISGCRAMELVAAARGAGIAGWSALGPRSGCGVVATARASCARSRARCYSLANRRHLKDQQFRARAFLS